MPSTHLDLKQIGYELRQARLRTGMSLREMHAASGVSASNILRIETGEFEPSLATFAKLCRALGVPAGLLIEDCSKPAWQNYWTELENSDVIKKISSDLKKTLKSKFDHGLHLASLIGVCRAILEYMLISSNPCRFSEVINDYPTIAIEQSIKKAAQRIERRFAATDRLSSLRALDNDCVSELQNFDMCSEEILIDFLKQIEKEKGAELWAPFLDEFAAKATRKIGLPGDYYLKNKVSEEDIKKAHEIPFEHLVKRFEKLTFGKGKRAAAANAIGISSQRLNSWITGLDVASAEELNRFRKWIETTERKLIDK